MTTEHANERYRTARVLLGEARARRIAGLPGFWTLLGMASSARRRAAVRFREPAQLDMFG